MRIETICCGLYGENAYLLYREAADEAILIDPGDDLEALLSAVGRAKKRLGAVILTHGHFDHMLSAPYLREKTGCRIYVHEADAQYLQRRDLCCYDEGASRLAFLPFEADEKIHVKDEGKTLSVCGYDLVALSTPGHTPGSICLLSDTSGVLFTGDTLFARGYGRMDLPGGSEQAMVSSLRKLMAMPRKIKIYPGHGDASTLGAAGDLLW